MLDLNVDSLCVDSSCDGTRRSINIINLLVESKCQADDSEASNSSVVNADEYPSNVGDEDSSSTRIMPSDGFFTVNFSILNSNKGQANCIENGLEIEDESIGITSSELVTMQLFPVSSEGGGEEFCSGFSSVTSVLRPQWLNLSVPESSRVPEFRAITPQKQQPLVKRSRRGPKSRSSQYRGVTFYRRTGRWESHIWDCGKQVYLGGFDTAHAAARAYDRAAIKFRGVDADINFVISDYEEDMEQTKNMTKEEFVHVLRRQSNGIPRGSSKYRGAILQKCAPWEARMGQFLDKKVNEKAVIKCNIREAATNFESTKIVQATNDGGGGHDLDLKLQISPPSLNAPKRNENENIRSPHFQFAASEMPAGKRQKLEVKTSGCAALTGGQASSGLTMASKQPLIGPGIYSHFKPYHEEIGKGIGKGGEAIGLTPKWPWQMNNHTLLSSTTTTTAASSGFSSTATSLSASLPPLSPLHQRPTTASFRRPPTGTTTTTTLSPLC